MRRRDRATFAAEYPRFRMNDDREVTCFALADEQLSGKDVREAAIAAWLAQKDADEGCAFLATTLADAKLLAPADIWKKPRASVEAGRPRAARQAGALLPEGAARGDRRDRRQPGALPREEGGHGDAQRRRADDARAGTPGGQRQRVGRVAAGRALGDARCRPTSRRTPGRASPGRPRSSCSPMPPTSSCAPARIARQDEARDRALGRDARLEGACRAARRQRQRALAAGRPGDQRDVAGRAEGRRLGVLEGARPAGAGARIRRRARACSRRSRELLAGICRAAQLLRRARRRRARPDAGAAAAAGTADARRARGRRRRTRASAARWR